MSATPEGTQCTSVPLLRGSFLWAATGKFITSNRKLAAFTHFIPGGRDGGQVPACEAPPGRCQASRLQRLDLGPDLRRERHLEHRLEKRPEHDAGATLQQGPPRLCGPQGIRPWDLATPLPLPPSCAVSHLPVST